MTDQIPLPPPDHTENVHGFVHDTERRYYSEQTMRAYAERLHAARVKTLPTQLMAGLQAEVDALRHQLQTLAELGDASGDAQILRMGYAAARLEIESLNTQLQTAREEIERRDAQLEAIGAGAASSAVGATSTAVLCVENKMDIEEAIEHAEERAGDCSTDCRREHKQLSAWPTELTRLRRYVDAIHGKGDVRHDYNGMCPDETQPDSRDDECPACRLLTHNA